jgi:ribosome-binding factor A
MNKQRLRRISSEIQRLISDLILQEKLKDPRVTKLTSITDVETTEDLRYAFIYVSVFNDDDEKNLEEALEGLNSAKGFIRKKISDEIKLHHAPEPIFRADSSIKKGMRIEEIIKELHDNE